MDHLTSFSKIVLDLVQASSLDKQTCETLVNEFYEQAVKIIHNIKNQMLKGELLETEMLLHRLKGSAGNVRAKKISGLAMEAEKAMKTKDFDKLSSLIKNIERSLEELLITNGEEEVAHDK